MYFNETIYTKRPVRSTVPNLRDTVNEQFGLLYSRRKTTVIVLRDISAFQWNNLRLVSSEIKVSRRTHRRQTLVLH